MDDQIITENLRGTQVKFKTRSGVFSKVGLDAGSRLLIDNMEIKDGTLIADLGAGTGIIGFVAAKLNPHGYVHLLEEHLRAKNLAEENAQLNKLRNVESFLSDLFSAVGERTYHTILSNPPQHLGNEILEEAAKQCFEHLKPEGQALWVVQKHVRPYIEKLFQNVLKNCTIVARSKEHVVVKGVKNG